MSQIWIVLIIKLGILLAKTGNKIRKLVKILTEI